MSKKSIAICVTLGLAFLLSFALLQTPSKAADDFQKVPVKLYDLRGGLPNFFAKLDAGHKVNIGYLGGSITAQNGWRPKTLKWFQKIIPRQRSARSTRLLVVPVPTWACFVLARTSCNASPT